jgi:hypothetical protein
MKVEKYMCIRVYHQYHIILSYIVLIVRSVFHLYYKSAHIWMSGCFQFTRYTIRENARESKCLFGSRV